ncbi:MAG: ATP-dependent zinc metalloprotease FtsH [Planctomycetota bacterium]|nr:ATP-dependent zinc metalloprotease FtsH [Planctomycetota bacterium]
MENESKKSKPKSQPERGDQENATPPRPRFSAMTIIFVTVLVIVIAMSFASLRGPREDEIPYSFFYSQLQEGNIERVAFEGIVIHGKFKQPPVKPKWAQSGKPPLPAQTEGEAVRFREGFFTNLPLVVDEKELHKELLANKDLVVEAEPPTDNTNTLIFVYLFVTVLLFAVIWFMFRRARDQISGGGGILSGFTKSPAQRYDSGKQQETFEDVAGLEGVKRDLQEVVEFLKDPEKFQRLGGRVPKGVLLNGPPGAGKTLLARAVAGEAGVPYFSISGSEFIQMFVGVGASRVRDLFKTAKEAAPSIMFIDEIDAVGRHRGAGLGGGHDEREQTLNQILSEMDGFQPNESVIVLAATNRPDVLDPALLRPGRFDRHITVDRPTHKGRVAIFGVHVRNVPLADDVDLEKLAAGTVGLTGADIRNLVNEAALWATREGKDKVDMDDFEISRDKILMGAKREEMLSEKEKKMTAYHEAGHALLAWIVPGNDRLHKVTVIPRGRALGVTQLLPEEDRMNINQTDLAARLIFMLGGRAAEKLVYNEYSAGAENDLSQATSLARRMVAHWGMSDRIGPVAYHISEDHPFLGKEIHEQRQFSEHTMQVIDEEVARILHGSADRAIQLLEEHREKLDIVALALVEREILDENEIAELIGPSVNQAAAKNGKPQADPVGETIEGSLPHRQAGKSKQEEAGTDPPDDTA